MRMKNSINNMIWDFIYSLLIILINFCLRKLIINMIGIELIGLNNILTQIVNLFSLAELGIANVIMFNLYKPLKQNDTKKIIQLMNLFKKFYNFVFLIIMIIGLLFIPFLHFFIKNYTISINYIYVYLLFLLQTATTYLFSYKMILMKADQKTYKYMKIIIILKLLTFIIEILLFKITKNYYLYLILDVINTIIINFIISLYISKKYEYLNNKSTLSKTESAIIKQNIKNSFISKVSGVVTESSDTVIISLFGDVTLLGLYSNYYIILACLQRIVNKIINGMQASIGNIIVDQNNDETYKLFCNINFLTYIFAILISISYYCLATPIVSIWIGNSFLLNNNIILLFSIQLFITIYKLSLWQFVTTKGLFNVDKISAIVGTILNTIISVILYLKIGLSGVILGTIISQMIQYIIKIYYLMKNLKLALNNIIKKNIIYLIIYIISIFLISLLKSFINELILCIISLVIMTCVLIFIYKNSNEFSYLKKGVFYVFNNKKNN